MLLNLKVENYKSIKTMDIDFSFGEKKAPNRYKELPYHPFIGNDKIRAVPCLALYGANVSGKSNLIKALKTLQEVMKKGLTATSYAPNVIQACDAKATFVISFYEDGKTFTYTLVYDAHQIIQESLVCNKIVVFSIKDLNFEFKNITDDTYSNKKLQSVFSVEALDKDKLFKKPFLSVLAKNYAALSKVATQAYFYLLEKLEIRLSNKISFEHAMRKLVDLKNKNEVNKAFERIVALLKKLDIGITKMEYQRKETIGQPKKALQKYEYIISVGEKGPKLIETEIRSYHLNHADEEVALPFGDESLGTRTIAPLLALMLYVLDNGLVLIIDELENSIHPLLLAELIRLFKDRRYNQNNAQLIFATHNTEVMDHELMRISEIGIINKTVKNGSQIVRISDFEGVRNVTRFRKQYLSGNFSGIPFPYI